MSDLEESNKIPVTFNDEQWLQIDKFKGILGNKRAEVIRTIVLDWLLDRLKESWCNDNKLKKGNDKK